MFQSSITVLVANFRVMKSLEYELERRYIRREQIQIMLIYKLENYIVTMQYIYKIWKRRYTQSMDYNVITEDVIDQKIYFEKENNKDN